MKVHISGYTGMIGSRIKEITVSRRSRLTFETYDPRTDNKVTGSLLVHLGEKPVSDRSFRNTLECIDSISLLTKSFDRIIYASSKKAEDFLNGHISAADEYIIRKLASEYLLLNNTANQIVRIPTVCDPFSPRIGTLIHKIAQALKKGEEIVLDNPEAHVEIIDLTEACSQLVSIIEKNIDRGPGSGLVSLEPTISMNATDVMQGLRMVASGECEEKMAEWIEGHNYYSLSTDKENVQEKASRILEFMRQVIKNA